MQGDGSRRWTASLVVLGAVVALVAWGAARGLVLSNAHNGLLALSLTGVGAYVVLSRPGHLEGALLLAAGGVEAVLFAGRQAGLRPESGGDRWWGWLGVWPVALALLLMTLAVLCFPDGRLPSPRWRPFVVGAGALALGCALLSALWPVEYGSTGVVTAHPVRDVAPGAVETVWSAVAHPTYALLQAAWVVAAVVRWRTASPQARRQLRVVGGAAALSVVALVVGLAVSGSPRAGLLATSLVPLAAGWALVHGRIATTYEALSWLSGDVPPEQRPTALARAVALALDAPAAGLLRTDGAQLGRWPHADPAETAPPPGWLRRDVVVGDRALGALVVDRPASRPLSGAERRLIDDLAAQAVLVLEQPALVGASAAPRALERLTPREQDVLALMAAGLTNAAICRELHLSVKTVEPLVSGVFAKLGLHADPRSNRRVLAVRAYLER